MPNKVVPASRLIDEVWGADPPGTAANILQSYVSQLRKALGKNAIETRGRGYVARVGAEALDLIEFERSAHHGSALLTDGRPDEAAAALRDALALWRGRALVDLDDQPAVAPIAARLDELHLPRPRAKDRGRPRLWTPRRGRRRGRRARARTPTPRAPTLASHARALPRGRQAEALDAYREARTPLVEELGIEPGSALQELERAILRHDPDLEHAGARDREQQTTSSGRPIVVAALDADAMVGLIELAAPLAVRAGRASSSSSEPCPRRAT